MAIAFGSAGTRFALTPAGTTYAIPYPSGIAADDLLVLFMVTNAATVTTPSGWTAVYNETTLSNPKGGLWIKKATGSESGTLSVTTTSATGNGIIFRFTGVDTTTPLDATSTSVRNTTAGTTSVIPAITTVTADTMLIYVNGANSSTATVSSATGTERIDNNSPATTGSRAGGLYTEPRAATGSTGTRTITISSSLANWGAMLALRPAAGGFTATGNLSGSGTLTGSATPNPAVTANLSGSGTLTSTRTPAANASGTLSGSGTLSSTRTVGFTSTANLSGTGTLSGVGVPGYARTGNLSGSGSLTASTTPSVSRTANLSGSGTLSGTATQGGAVEVTVNLSGSGTLTSTRLVGFTRSVSLGGSGTLTATAKPGFARTVGLSGSGTLSASASPAFATMGALSGVGVLESVAVPEMSVIAELSGAGELTATAHNGIELVVLGSLAAQRYQADLVARVGQWDADLPRRWNADLGES